MSAKREKQKNQDGAIVIEATLSLTTFMFLVVVILSVTNICLAQAKIGTLIHGIAKDVSSYSYIYTMAGLDSLKTDASEKATQARESIDTVLSDTAETYEKLAEIANVAFDNEFWSSFVSLVEVEAANEMKAVVLDKICREIAEDRLTMNGSSADSYLRWLGVRGGVDGLDFSSSEFCAGGSDEIKIIVEYDVHVLKLLGVDFSFHFEQCAYTRAWQAADS